MALWYSLVDLLPFDWAQPGSMFFMKNALLAVLVISPLFGLLSTMVVESRMSFFSDALGHSAFTGIAIGALLGASVKLFAGADPMWFAVLFAVVFALLFTFVRRRTALASDTVIGVFSSTAVALGIFIATLGGGSFIKYNALLIGDILSVEPAKIGLLALILLVLVLLWALSFNQLLLASVHPALADSRGIRVFWQEALFSAAIAVVDSNLHREHILPSEKAFAYKLKMDALSHQGITCGQVGHKSREDISDTESVAGLMTSYYIGSSAGASITLYLALFFACTFALRKKRL